MLLLFQFFFQIVFGKHIAVFDCGSSGTRVLLINYTDIDNVYSFEQYAANYSSYWYCNNRTKKMTTPENKLAISKDIHRILITEGIDTLIPEEQRKDVPLLFYHTAGMRELEEDVQNEINDYLYQYMKENTKYDVKRENFKVLAGWEESLYQWLTVNQIMKFINSNSTMPILHMGGESMQLGLELRDPPEDDFMKSFVYTIELNGKYHYIFLYSWLKYGTDSLADISHVDRVNKGIMITPCMFVGGSYDIEVHSNEHPEGYYYSLKGTGDFDNCVDLMIPIFTRTHDLTKCHGYPQMVSDYLQEYCIPFPDKFSHIFGGSCVGDALRYLKDNGKDIEEPLTFSRFLTLVTSYAKTPYDEVIKENNNDENAGWTLSNAAMVSEFMKKAFNSPSNLGEKGLDDVQMYYRDEFDDKLQAWNLGAAIAHESTGFKIIVPELYKESWFTAGRIAGITAGGVILIGLVIGIVLVIVQKKRKNNEVQLGSSVMQVEE